MNDAIIDFKNNISAFDEILPSKQLIKHFLTVSKLIKNWPILFKLALLRNSHTTILLKSGKRIEVNNIKEFLSFWHSYEGQLELLRSLKVMNNMHIDFDKHLIQFYYMQRNIVFDYGASKEMLEQTLEWIRTQFFEGQYSWLDVKDRDVIDIGAAIGDTAIYFALRGAKRVYAFEIDSNKALLALTNAKLNGFENIKVINAGCTGSKINSNEKNLETLDDIIKSNNISNAVLKMDCEGCEYDSIINSEDTTLKAFKQIMIEYHRGYKNLEKRLKEAGFHVWHSRPEIFKEGNEEYYLGLLYAIRK